MELFAKTKAVKLRSHLDKYLIADDDQETVRQSKNGSLKRAIWVIELVPNKPNVIHLRSCYGKHLTASDIPFLLGMTGNKVLQTVHEKTMDWIIEWEPVRDGFQFKFKSWCGKFLRANGGTPPWRNSLTHDEPHTGSTKNWILWDVEVVDVPETGSFLEYLSSVSSFSSVSNEVLEVLSDGALGSGPESPMSVVSSQSPMRRSFFSVLSMNSPRLSPKKTVSKSNGIHGEMDLFHNAKAVRLRSHHDKFLIAEEDEESVTQDRNGSSKNAKWTVEPVPGSQSIIRLKSCYGKYLTASNQPFLLGMTGRKVTQSLPRRLDSSVEWEPVREANQVKLKTRYGHFLRANMGLPPWRNSVTHDIPHRTATQDWILWDVHVVEIQVQSPRGQQEAQPPPTIPHSDSLDFDSSSPFSVSINSGKFSRQESNDSDVGSPPKSEGRTIYYHMADESGEVDDDSLQGFAMTFKGNGVDELTQKLREELGIQDLFVCTRSPLNGKLYPVRLQLPPITADMHVIVVPSSSNAYGCSYESKKRRDWNTFLQYIKNQRPPLTLERCSGAHVIEYLRYLDQFGKTKVHVTGCLFFGIPDPPAPCYCPLRQSWGSLDALIGRLRAAYEENGGLPESNPFGCRDVRIFLNEVRKHQAEARGIPYDKKESSAAERKKKNRQDKAVPIPYYEKEKASTAMSVGEGSGTGPAAGSGSREASENAAAATTTTKLEHVSFSNEDKLASVFDEVCDRLDSDASVFWSHKDLKQLRLKLAQVYDFLGHSKRCPFDQNVLNLWLSDLKSLPCDVDDLLDDWEQLEISRLKFNQEVRRIHEWLVRFLNLFQKLVTGHYEDRSAIPELSSARSDEYTIFERDLERSIDSVKHVLLLDVNVVRIITILGVSGIGKTVLAQRIYSNGKVKSHFPLRFWFKVDMNLEFSTVVKAIEIRCCEIRVAEKMLSKRLLIVLDNVCDLDDEKLDKFRLLISDIRDSGSCVLVTTRSDHVATTMRTVPAQHFSYFPESDSLSNFNSEILPALQARNHGLGHEKDLRLEAPEYAVMAELQSNSESATDEDPELSPEDEISCPPPKGMLAVHESKIQLTPFETGELAVQVPGMMATLERNVQRIFRCVTDVTALKIGVHGVGGIGKTAALRALICFPEIKGLFDMVILVTVSRYWNTRKIQNEVLKQLSLRPEDYETDSEVAERLLQILNGKKFLLLLDDVWEQINLKSMGIPVPSAENGCKILMASRKLDVCHNMNVSKVIELESLSWKEAWQLFYEQVGGIVQSPAIQPFARAVVKGCNGLPLLIIVTGKALVEENNDCTWEHASKKFSPPGTARVYQTEDVIHLLKFSFDQLKDDDIKSCFLYCGLFSEDQEVNIYGLIEYCFQEGIINGTHADAHKRGCDIIDVLVKASLVKVTRDNDSIKMHGLIRDLALGIISSSAEHDAQSLLRAEGSQFLLRAYSRLVEPPNTNNSSSSSLESPERSKMFIPEAHQFLLGAHAGLTDPPSEEEWKCAKMIFLMDNELYTLPNRPSCPNLLTLFLQRNSRLRVIPPYFFELMTSLKVLNLSKTSIKSLPKTLVNLKRLQILILRDCELLLVLPSEVGSLECLEVLDLGGTEINKLPDEIVKLTSLRYLNVFFYGSIDKSENIKLPCNLISGGTLSGLQALETLSIVVYPGDKRWDNDVKHVIAEVSKLTNLSSLCFYFPKIEYVAEFLKESVAWKDQQLTEFKFVVGHDVKSIVSRVADYVQFDYNQQDRCLRFVNGKGKSTEVLPILGRCTAFYVDHHLGIDSLSKFGGSNMNGLKLCIISECPGIKTVVDIKEHTSTAVFPSLENLTVNYLWNLTCIWEGILPEGSFAELRILSVHACQQLECVFTSSMIRFLSKLEELTVEHCPAIKSIIRDGEIIDSSCIMLPSLKKLRLHYLPELVNIWSNDWPSLEYISFYGCPKLKKIGMDPKLKDTLTWIKAEKKWWAELDWEDTELPIHLEDRLSTFSCSFSEDNEDQEP